MFSSNTTQIANAATYIEDVFSTYLYTGNSSTQTITNGIALSTYGGLVWGKSRSGAYNHELVDTVRGAGNALRSNQTSASTTSCDVNSFTTTGFTLNSAGGGEINANTVTEVAWTFRKAANFFDVVTYTGTGVARTVSHSLGSTPGCIIVKCTTTGATNWRVYHNGLTSSAYTIQLDQTNAQSNQPSIWNSTAPTASSFTVGTDPSVNSLGDQYVAYIFAHNAGGFGLTGTDNVISCGSFTADGSGNATVSLGYEPQWLLVKSASGTSNWWLADTMRGMTASNQTNYLSANTSNAEGGPSALYGPTATGFNAQAQNASQTYIYIAIRRPNKPPTSGTQVFSPIARSGTGASGASTGFGNVTDLVFTKQRGSTQTYAWTDRLRGATKELTSAATTVETAYANDVTGFDTMTGFLFGSGASGQVNTSGSTYVDYLFKRAPGFMDVVCYTGINPTLSQIVPHNLTVIPELIIAKCRNQTNGNIRDYWFVTSSSLPGGIFTGCLALQLSDGKLPYSFLEATSNTSVTVSNNCTSGNWVMYLFATLAGISKVGSYTGTGSTQTISCGFTGGARFVLIKRTDSTGDWYIWDTARGMVSGTDPSLLLNSTAAEVNANSIYTTTGGFQIVSTAAGINASGGSYIYLAIA